MKVWEYGPWCGSLAFLIKILLLGTLAISHTAVLMTAVFTTKGRSNDKRASLLHYCLNYDLKRSII